MCVIRKNLVRDRIDILALIVLGEVELDEVTALQSLAIYGVRAMLLYPWQNVSEVEDGAFGGADGVFEGLERDGAEVEGEALEVGAWRIRFARICAGRCAKGILAGPLAVRDLREGVSACDEVEVGGPGNVRTACQCLRRVNVCAFERPSEATYLYPS